MSGVVGKPVTRHAGGGRAAHGAVAHRRDQSGIAIEEGEQLGEGAGIEPGADGLAQLVGGPRTAPDRRAGGRQRGAEHLPGGASQLPESGVGRGPGEQAVQEGHAEPLDAANLAER